MFDERIMQVEALYRKDVAFALTQSSHQGEVKVQFCSVVGQFLDIPGETVCHPGKAAH